MLNRETAFTDLLKPENFERIKIDAVLKPHFAKVMEKLQEYFSKTGLMNANNYALYLEKNLLTENNSQVRITHYRFEGMYTKKVAGIFISQKNLLALNKAVHYAEEYDSTSAYRLQATLLHEFVHFLVVHDSPFIETNSGKFVQSEMKDYQFEIAGLFNEGFTEKLTREIFPRVGAYDTYCSILEAFNEVVGEKVNYFEFLRGRLPFKNSMSSAYLAFVEAAEKYSFVSGYSLDSYELEKPEFIKVQEKLLDHFENLIMADIDKVKFRTPYEFIRRIYRVSSKFVGIEEKFSSVVNKLISSYLDKYYPIRILHTKDEVAQKLLDAVHNFEAYNSMNFIGKAATKFNGHNFILDVFEDKYIVRVLDEKQNLKFVREFKSTELIKVATWKNAFNGKTSLKLYLSKAKDGEISMRAAFTNSNKSEFNVPVVKQQDKTSIDEVESNKEFLDLIHRATPADISQLSLIRSVYDDALAIVKLDNQAVKLSKFIENLRLIYRASNSPRLIHIDNNKIIDLGELFYKAPLSFEFDNIAYTMTLESDERRFEDYAILTNHKERDNIDLYIKILYKLGRAGEDDIFARKSQKLLKNSLNEKEFE